MYFTGKPWNSGFKHSPHLLVCGIGLSLGWCNVAQAQSSEPSYVLTVPIVDITDQNHVSIMDGKVQIKIPLLKMNSVEYVVNNTAALGLNGNSINDNNYGHVVACMTTTPNTGYGGSGECASGGSAVQAVYGAARTTFNYQGGQYVAAQGTGESFVDGGTSCTWTQKDGTKIIYYGYHTSGNPMCQSQSISSIVYPNGRVTNYYYYGTVSNSAVTPLLSVATSDGFLLKYNYPSTPQFGAQTSVVALNRAFQACDPAATSCASSAPWPTATFNSQAKTVAVSDNFPAAGLGYSGFKHLIVTLTDQASHKHIFETDSYGRVITYQPPGSETPIYSYTLCSLLADPDPTDVHWPMKDCFGQTDWRLDEPNDNAPSEIGLVQAVTKNGQVWNYGIFPTGSEGYPAFHRWTHAVTSPLGVTLTATGNGTGGEEYMAGPTQKVTNADGSYYSYQSSVANPIVSFTDASLAVTSYTYDTRQNLTSETRTPVPGSGTTGQLVRTASYPVSCANPLTCNKPDYVIDANNNRTDFTYDPNHGGLLTETGPAVNGIHPQKRYTYVQRFAWYLGSAGVMTQETRPIWVLSSESHCISGAPASSGTGCSVANDEVVTTYDYGPDSGPNNLLLRGQAVTWNGQTHRVCFGHDRSGNKIWESAPNAAPSSCPAY